MERRTRFLLAALTVAAFAAVAIAPILASAQDERITATARESGCGDTTLCFDLSGAASVAPGATVEFTLVNPDDNDSHHNLYVDTTGDYDTNHDDTAADAAEQNTDDVDPGNQTTLTVTAPMDGDLYIWCEVSGHESLGMWARIPVTSDTTNGDDGTGDGGQNGVPGFGAVAALAAAGIVAAFLVRRRE